MKDYCSKCRKYVDIRTNELKIGRETLTTCHCSECNTFIKDMTTHKKGKTINGK